MMYKVCTILNLSYQYFQIEILILFNYRTSGIKLFKDFYSEILVQKDSNLCIGDTYYEWFKLPEVFYKVSREVTKKSNSL